MKIVMRVRINLTVAMTRRRPVSQQISERQEFIIRVKTGDLCRRCAEASPTKRGNEGGYCYSFREVVPARRFKVSDRY